MVPPFVFTKVRKNIESKHFHIKKRAWRSSPSLAMECFASLTKRPPLSLQPKKAL